MISMNDAQRELQYSNLKSYDQAHVMYGRSSACHVGSKLVCSGICRIVGAISHFVLDSLNLLHVEAPNHSRTPTKE